MSRKKIKKEFPTFLLVCNRQIVSRWSLQRRRCSNRWGTRLELSSCCTRSKSTRQRWCIESTERKSFIKVFFHTKMVRSVSFFIQSWWGRTHPAVTLWSFRTGLTWRIKGKGYFGPNKITIRQTETSRRKYKACIGKTIFSELMEAISLRLHSRERTNKRTCLLSFSRIGSVELTCSSPFKVQTLTVPVVVSARTTSSIRFRGRRTWKAEILNKIKIEKSQYIKILTHGKERNY